MTLDIGTLDRKIWSKDLILKYLYDCYKNNNPATIDMLPEGSCATELGLYNLLDQFCETTGYSKSLISVKTANMLEYHDQYNIVRHTSGWYEVGAIQTWLKDKELTVTVNPTKHFANFTSRTNWSRLWIATILDTYYLDKTVQTYHYDKTKDNYNHNKYVGLDDLVRYDCLLVAEAVKFLQSCPRTIDLEYLQNLENSKDSVFQHENSYYPIQHPSNLNLLQYYRDIFVDIVVEPNVHGNCFLVTEKLWRPIIARRPFIVMSNQNYLLNLRKLGFKTFDTMWNEDYDQLSCDQRILKIHSVLEQISSWSLEELSNKLAQMNSILEHNLLTFKQLNYKKISEVFDAKP